MSAHVVEGVGSPKADVVASPGFEGVEKSLEIDFAPGFGEARGLRDITRAQWDAILGDARCTILDTLSNDRVDSYVLSESSLFVYPLKLVLKTCGTTTLLVCLKQLLEATAALSMKVEWMSYTRKDFNFPTAQQFPHRAPAEEIAYLREFFPEGSAFLMGPVTGDHWFVYVADYVDRPTSECVDRTLDMMMFGIDENVAKLFVKDKDRFPSDKDVTVASGISLLLPGSSIQEFCFEPCGYSMNGLLYDSYWTIHITPESHCSYASFETNIRMSSYLSLIKAVLAIFQPKRFTCTLFADEFGLRELKGGTSASSLAPLVIVPLIDSAAATSASAGGAAGASPVAAAASSLALQPNTLIAAGGSGGGGGAGEEEGERSSPGVIVGNVLGGSSPRHVGTLNYVQTHKSMSEFQGYSCFMGNYGAVHTLPQPRGSGVGSGGVGGGGVYDEAVVRAATASLAMPRAKYIVSQRVEELRLANRLRTESV